MVKITIELVHTDQQFMRIPWRKKNECPLLQSLFVVWIVEIPILWVLEMSHGPKKHRQICRCRKCGNTYRSLMKATACCLGRQTPVAILTTGRPSSEARDPAVPASRAQTVQHQLSLTGSGHFCRLGCCDFSQKYEKHRCIR